MRISFCRQYMTGVNTARSSSSLPCNHIQSTRTKSSKDRNSWNGIASDSNSRSWTRNQVAQILQHATSWDRAGELFWLSELNACESNNTTDRRQGMILPLRAIEGSLLAVGNPSSKIRHPGPTTREFWDRIIYRDT